MKAAFYMIALLLADFTSRALARYKFHQHAAAIHSALMQNSDQAPTSARWNSAQLTFAAFLAPFSVKVSKQRALVV